MYYNGGEILEDDHRRRTDVAMLCRGFKCWHSCAMKIWVDPKRRRRLVLGGKITIQILYRQYITYLIQLLIMEIELIHSHSMPWHRYSFFIGCYAIIKKRKADLCK